MTLRIQSDKITATFKREGAELTSLKRNDTDIEFLWQGDEAFWGRQAPVLFPIVGRLKNDSYTFEGETFAMTQHGFARDQVFEVVNQTQTTLVFSLTSNDQLKKIYPFDFELQIAYEVTGDNLSTSYIVKNLSEKEMYYSVGGHPAFNVPFDGEGLFDDYHIHVEMGAQSRFIPLEGSYLNEEKAKEIVHPIFDLKLTRDLFEDDALVYETKGATTFTLSSEKSPHQLIVSYKNLPYVGIWSPYPKDAPFVCLEPWQGIADTTNSTGDLTEKKGIICLGGTQKNTHEYIMTLK